jgi:hypothetical protein
METHSSALAGRGIRPGRDILLVLAVKAAALALLYVLCFGPSHRPSVTPDQFAATLFPSAPLSKAP